MTWSGTAATDDTLIPTLHATATTATIPPATTPTLTTSYHEHAGRHPGMYLHHHHNRTQTRNYTLRDFSQLWPRYARTYALLTGHKHAHHEALHMHDSPPPALTMSPPYHPHLTGRKSAHAQTGTFTYINQHISHTDATGLDRHPHSHATPFTHHHSMPTEHTGHGSGHTTSVNQSINQSNGVTTRRKASHPNHQRAPPAARPHARACTHAHT